MIDPDTAGTWLLIVILAGLVLWDINKLKGSDEAYQLGKVHGYEELALEFEGKPKDIVTHVAVESPVDERLALRAAQRAEFAVRPIDFHGDVV